MSLHAVQSDHTHAYTHISLLSTSHPLRWTHSQKIDLVMIKRLLRTSDMMTNVCCAAKASRCQHAGFMTCYREEHFKKWTPCPHTAEKDRQGMAATVAINATIAACV